MPSAVTSSSWHIASSTHSTGGGSSSLARGTLAVAMTDHADVWMECIARATGRDAEWIARLSDSDGQALSAAMWSVNTDFFGRRVIKDVRRRRQATPSPSPTSSMPSSGPGTDADTAMSPSG